MLASPSTTQSPPQQLPLHHPLLPYAFLALPLGLLVVFFLVPLLWAIGMSALDDSHNLFKPVFVGFHNYQTLLSSPRFWQVLLNTLWFMVLVVPAMVVLPIPVALLLNHSLPGMRVFRTLIYIPVVVSLVVAGIAWKWLFDSNGLINYGLTWLATTFHIPNPSAWALDWLVAPQLAMIAIAIMVVWKGLGYYMMMYLANLQSISTELYDAARVDGANSLQTHWHISLPHLKPTMAMVGIISTIGALKAFTEMYVMTRGGPIGATETVAYYVYDQAFGNLNIGLACTAGVVLMVIIFGISLIHIQWSYLKAEQSAYDSN